MVEDNDNTDNVAHLTLRVLRDIRAEAKATNDRLDATNDRLDATNDRLDATNKRLDATNHRLENGFGELRQEMHHSFGQFRQEMHHGFAQVRYEMNQGFQHVGKRVDNVLMGQHRTEHRTIDDRLSRIEDHLDLDPT